jgi:hypothetical protein
VLIASAEALLVVDEQDAALPSEVADHRDLRPGGLAARHRRTLALPRSGRTFMIRFAWLEYSMGVKVFR